MLEKKQDNTHVNCYTSFKFLQCSIPLQFNVPEDSHGILEPVTGEVSNESACTWHCVVEDFQQ